MDHRLELIAAELKSQAALCKTERAKLAASSDDPDLAARLEAAQTLQFEYERLAADVAARASGGSREDVRQLLAARRQFYTARIAENRTETGPRDESAALASLVYGEAVEYLNYLLDCLAQP